MKETELAKKFIDFFDDNFEIYQEVPAGGEIDFVAKSGIITIAVEVKLSLNFKVIEQANKNKNYCVYSYIAVLEPKKHHFGLKICEMLGIGVLTLDKYDNIYERIKPKMNRRSKWFKLNLQEYMKKSVAGTKGAQKAITPFKMTIENMVKYIKRHPGCLLKDCLNNIDYHWSSLSSAKGCVYQWLKKGIIKDFYIDNGKLYLKNRNKVNV